MNAQPVNRYQIAAVNRLTGDDLQTLPVRSKDDADRQYQVALNRLGNVPMIVIEVRTLH